MNLFAIAGLSCAIACIVLAAVTFILSKTRLHRILLFFNIAVAFWGLGLFLVGIATSENEAILGWKIAHFGGFFIGTLFYHLTCIFCNIQRYKILLFAYGQAILFNFLNFFSEILIYETRLVFGLYYNDINSVLLLGILIYVTLVILSFYELFKLYPKTQGIKRLQAAYVIIGFSFGFIGGTSTFLPEFHIDMVYPLGNFGITIYCLVVSYAILRYRLLDINFVIKKTAVYSLSAGLLSGIFVVVVLTLTRLIANFAAVSSFKISILAAVLIALIFDPLRNRVQRIVDRVFYKKTYDYYLTLQHISRELGHLFDAEKIYNFVGNVIFSALGLRNVHILSAVPGGNYHVVYMQAYDKDKTKRKKQDTKGSENIHEDKKLAQIKNNSGAIRYLEKTKDILIREEILRTKQYEDEEMITSLQSDLLPFQGEAIVPVLIDDRLQYLIILGEKLSGDIFTDEDIKLLNTISNQTAIAMKNARLYSEKITAERLASIGMVSATFAHEIRNPLTSIKTFAQLMPEKYADKEFRESFSKIANDEITRIDRLIKDLMSFSSKNVAPPIDMVNLTEILNKTINTVKVQLELEEKDITIEKLFQITPMNIHGDFQKLEQSFMNIINNGCQAMGEKGRLTVDFRQNGQYVDVKIIDTGKGIPYTEINKIFDPFFTTRSRGVGLGLAISRKIIEDHGGEISVESRVSRGTTFTVSLPIYSNLS